MEIESKKVNPAVLFGRSFHEKRIHLVWRADIIGPILQKIYSPTSYLDVGCGIGEFVKWFHEHGVDSCGADGSWFPDDLYLGPKESLFSIDLTNFRGSPLPRVDLLTCFMTIGRIDEKHWRKIAGLFTRTSDQVVTVVEKGDLWRECMEHYGYMETEDITASIKNDLATWQDKTAIRSFYTCVQAFRRIF
jgi:hypothetical protein